MTTALIDGDVVAYTAAAVCQRDTTFDGGEPTFHEEEVRDAVGTMLDSWTRAAEADDRVVLLTGSGNFRKLVAPTYKENRKGKPKPIALGFARKVLLEDHGARLVDGLEADDLIGLMLTGSMAGGRGIAVSIDKDLRTVPGLHCNPAQGGGVRSITEDEANRLWMRQVLTGDPVDGFGGARGIGPKKAEAALAGKTSLEGLWKAVVETYTKIGMTSHDALITARLARILRTGDYDKDKREVILWHPSTPQRLALPSSKPTPSSPTTSPTEAPSETTGSSTCSPTEG